MRYHIWCDEINQCLIHMVVIFSFHGIGINTIDSLLYTWSSNGTQYLIQIQVSMEILRIVTILNVREVVKCINESVERNLFSTNSDYIVLMVWGICVEFSHYWDYFSFWLFDKLLPLPIRNMAINGRINLLTNLKSSLKNKHLRDYQLFVTLKGCYTYKLQCVKGYHKRWSTFLSLLGFRWHNSSKVKF